MVSLGPLAIPGLGRRGVRLYVPRGRRGAAPVADRPLLVMFDGQNIFDDAPSFAGGWHLHEAVEKRARARRAAVAPVVVGLEHGGVLRVRELNPFAPERWLDAQLDQVEATLLPALRARLGLPLAQVWIGGSSMGGLAALYAHLARPELFRGAMALSPALPITRGAFMAWFERRPTPAVSRIYLDAGGRGGDRLIGAEARRLATRLRQRGWRPDELMWHFVKSGPHTEAAWRRRLPRALRFLFG